MRGRRARALRLGRVFEILFESVAHGGGAHFHRLVDNTRAIYNHSGWLLIENSMMAMARGCRWSHSARRLGRLAGRRDGFRGG